MKKIKTMLVAVAITLASYTQALAQTERVELCMLASELAFSTATARDNGITMGEAYGIMTAGGMPAELAMSVIQVVYVVNEGKPPEEIMSKILQHCLSQPT